MFLSGGATDFSKSRRPMRFESAARRYFCLCSIPNTKRRHFASERRLRWGSAQDVWSIALLSTAFRDLWINETDTRARATLSLKIGRELPICKPPGVGASFNPYSKWKFRIRGNRSWPSLSASTLDNRTALWRNCGACGGMSIRPGSIGYPSGITSMRLRRLTATDRVSRPFPPSLYWRRTRLGCRLARAGVPRLRLRLRADRRAPKPTRRGGADRPIYAHE